MRDDAWRNDNRLVKAPQIIKTESGAELVAPSRADYDALIEKLEEAAEDAADVAAYDAAKAALASGADRFLSADETAAVLARR